MPMSGPLAPLRNPLFRRLWLANMVANLGIMFQSVGAAWVMMTLTGSPQMVALVQSSVTLPLLIFSLFSGALADTLDRRRLMLAAQIFLTITALGLTVLVVTDMLTPPLLLIFTFLIGCGSALHIPSWQASLRDLVDRSDLASAVSMHSMGFNLMRSAGPALGGAILALAGAAILFGLSAACYFTLALTLILWRKAQTQTLGREPLPSALLSGLRYSAMSPKHVNVIVRATLFSGMAVAVMALLPLVAGAMLGGGSVLFGVLLGSFGVGAVAAALLSTMVRERLSTEQTIRLAFIGSGMSAVVIALSSNVYATVIVTFVAGCCWVLSNSTLNVNIQMSTPTWVAGRSLSLFHTGVFGGMALGSFGWGFLAETMGIQMALIISGVALIGGSLLGYVLPLAALADDSLEPANRFREPEVKVDFSERSGPIIISIHYRITPENTPEFLRVMKRRRQVRRRDGAHRWSLRRDVEHPDYWTETYKVRNWAEYVRHNQRQTEVDAEIHDQLWALHSGPNPPAVLRLVEWDAISPTPKT